MAKMVSMANSFGGRRRRTSQRRRSAPRAPQRLGATIPSTERRPGQTDTRARGSIDQTAFDPTPPPTLMEYQKLSPFSSFRVPHKRHKRLTLIYRECEGESKEARQCA